MNTDWGVRFCQPLSVPLLKRNWNPSGGEHQSSLAHDWSSHGQDGQRIHIFHHFIWRLYWNAGRSVLWLCSGQFQALVARLTQNKFWSTSKPPHIWFWVSCRGQVDTRGLHFRGGKWGGDRGGEGSEATQLLAMRDPSPHFREINQNTALSFPE